MKVDNITLGSWKGNVGVATVLLLTSWNLDQEMVERHMPAIGTLLAELDSSGYNMAYPFGPDAKDDESLEEDGNLDTMLQDEIDAAILNTMLQDEINAAILNTLNLSSKGQRWRNPEPQGRNERLCHYRPHSKRMCAYAAR